MSKVVKLVRKPRPLQKTYNPELPYIVERQDWEDGSISYEILDSRPESYRILTILREDEGEDRGEALRDANLIVRALNFYHTYSQSPRSRK